MAEYLHFKEAITLNKQEFIVSPMDLNREQGQIEKPLVPVVRLVQPVFGENNVRYGVVVVNLFADAFFQYFRAAENALTGGQYYLINEKGVLLYQSEAAQKYSYFLGHAVHIHTLFSGVMNTLQQHETGALFSEGHVVGFKRIYPHPQDKKHYWIIVGSIEETQALIGLHNFKTIFFSLVALILVLVFMVSYYYVGSLVEPLLFVTHQLQRLGKGQVQSETLLYHRQDEIRQMLDSTNRLITNMEILANQADTIAQGDFSSDVQLLSDQDRLGLAINNMTTMLRKSRAESNQQNWLKDGVGNLSLKLSGDLSPQLLAERAISLISQALQVGRGVLYVYNGQEETLELLGSYMFSQRSHLANRFRLGEGAVGQAAKERKPIMLTIQDAHETAPIVTGTTSTAPRYVCTWPLLRDDALIGVLELSGFEPLTQLQQEYLEAGSSVVTSFILMALQRKRIANLLRQSEENAKQAEAQSQQLQGTNALMEEQQQQLQQQTEELQQTNAHMEEQQQQLEQQADELRRNNAALQRSQEEVNARARQLEDANRYKSDFLANMSHELRTPLNAIIVISKMLSKNEEGTLDEETVKRTQVVHDAGNDLLRLINDILDLSKIEAGHVELHLQTFATQELADEMQSLFKDSSKEKQIQYLVEDTFQNTLYSDRHKVVQIIRNLLSNAFKFTRAGEVALRFEPSHDSERPLRVRVSDSGIGIPSDELCHIFEEFHQVDGSISRQFGGTGLGLSITKKFVALLQGSITVQSIEGQGSEFILLLPAHLSSVQELPMPAHAMSGVTTGRSHHTHHHTPVQVVAEEVGLTEAGLTEDKGEDKREDKREEKGKEKGKEKRKDKRGEKGKEKREETILVIDDDPHFQKNIVLINRHKGLHTLVAKSGAEGLALARSHRPKGIVLDLNLPDMRGEKVLESLKIDPELMGIPVCIISAEDKNQLLLQQGAVGVLQKPLTDSQIESAEISLLSTLQPDHKNILIIEGVALKQALIAEKVAAIQGRLTAFNLAREGLQAVAKERFDLVLVDYNMVDMECLQFCEKLRAQQAGTPIIIYVDQPLDEESLSKLRHYTDSVIQQAPQAINRVSRGIERLLNVTTVNDETRRKESIIGNKGQVLHGKSILLVDDDPRNLFVLTSALEQNGAKVIKALNGRKGMEQLKQEKVDLIVMDIMMPAMDGYKAIKAIRADAGLKSLPIIALTAKAHKNDRQKCLDAGADDYLAKPVDYDLFVNMVQAWVGKRS